MRCRAESPSVEPWDVVEYDLMESAPEDDKTQGLGVVLEDGSIQPLCIWQAGSTEFVWDEDLDPVASSRVLSVIDMDQVFQSTRQVGGGMGPLNPHGEESEDVFIIDTALAPSTRIVLREDREIFW